MSAAEQLTDSSNIVTGGDGLYVDTYEPGRYVYRGANPDNYVRFNDELWRIISVDKNYSLKIISHESVGAMTWDATESNNWIRPATLNTYLNDTFYDALSDYAKELTVSGTFYTGSVDFFMDMQETIGAEKTGSWTGKVGLRTVSDFFKASTNTECNPAVNGWLSSPLGADQQNYKCSSDNYFYKGSGLGIQWLMNPRVNFGDRVYYINGYGAVNSANTNLVSSASGNVYPVVHLTSNLRIDSGTGTSVDPYVVRGMCEADVKVSINSAIALSLDTNDLVLEPIPNGEVAKEDVVVSVSTNDVVGYKLVMSVAEGSGNTNLNYLNPTTISPTPAISSIASDGELGVNTWGYGVGESNGVSSFKPVPSYSLPDTLKTQSGLSLNDITAVSFGVRVNMDVPAGSYQNTVAFTVIANL